MIKAENKIVVPGIHILILLCGIVVSIVAAGCGSDNSTITGEKYHKVNGVYGTIKISGSTTMSNLVSLWCNGFSDIYHNTNCVVESFGSRKAPQDLLAGGVDIGTMSEPMSAKDIQDFKNAYGYAPEGIKVAIDMIAVLVNMENPVECMTVDELDGVYSNTYSCEGSADITTWGDLIQDDTWKNIPIKIYGRTPASGTYDVFRKTALCNGSYKDSITELASSKDIVDFVSKDVYSIGYTGAGYLTSGVKAVKVGKTKNGCYPPRSEFAISKQYPFTRDLYIYPRENPSKGMKKLTSEFLKYILSKDGQEAVLDAGFTATPSGIINEEKKKITERSAGPLNPKTAL